MLKGRRILIGMASTVAAGVVVVASAFGPSLVEPAAAIQLSGDPSCRLQQGPCSIGLPEGGSLTLDVQPRPIPVMQPINIDVSFEGVEAEAVEVDFNGVDMNMGINNYRLDASGRGRFGGKGVLPICIRDRMEWEALVSANTAQGRITAPFRFESVK